MSHPPCRSSGRPDAIPQRVAEGRQWCHGRFRAARGRSSLHGEPGCLRRNVRGLGSVDLDCGDKPPPSGGRSEQSAGGQALRFRGNPRGPPERGGKFRSRRRGPTSHYCGLPAMRPGPRRRSSSLLLNPKPHGSRARWRVHFVTVSGPRAGQRRDPRDRRLFLLFTAGPRPRLFVCKRPCHDERERYPVELPLLLREERP
jgi:hypothetical protein